MGNEVTLTYTGYTCDGGFVHYCFTTKEFGVVSFKTEEDWLHHPNPVIVLMELSYSLPDICRNNPRNVWGSVEKLLDLTKDQTWVKKNMVEWLGLFIIQQQEDLNRQKEIVKFWCKGD